MKIKVQISWVGQSTMRTLNSTSKTRFWTMWNLVFSSERKYEKQSQKWAGLIMSCQSRRCSHCSISCGPRIDVHIWTIYSLPGKCWQMIGHSGRKRQCNNHQCTHHLSCVFEAGHPLQQEKRQNQIFGWNCWQVTQNDHCWFHRRCQSVHIEAQGSVLWTRRN